MNSYIRKLIKKIKIQMANKNIIKILKKKNELIYKKIK
jgi:hypothetical protein